MEEKPTCKNCKHFLQHYVIYKAKYQRTNWGHCSEQLRKRRVKEYPFSECCKKWKAKDIREERETVENALKKACRALKQVAEIILSER